MQQKAFHSIKPLSQLHLKTLTRAYNVLPSIRISHLQSSSRSTMEDHHHPSNLRQCSPSSPDPSPKRVCIHTISTPLQDPSTLPQHTHHQPPSGAQNSNITLNPTPQHTRAGRKRKTKKPISSGDQSIQFSLMEILGEETYADALEQEINWKASGWDLEKGNVIEMKIEAIGSFGMCHLSHKLEVED